MSLFNEALGSSMHSFSLTLNVERVNGYAISKGILNGRIESLLREGRFVLSRFDGVFGLLSFTNFFQGLLSLVFPQAVVLLLQFLENAAGFVGSNCP